MTTMKYVELSRPEPGIAVLMLSNPPLNLNTLTTSDQLLNACTELSQDTSVRVVIVTGAGDRAFCAGSDISEFSDVRDKVVELKLARENEAFTAVADLPMPVIAALNGVTLGGGAEIALACDIRIMDRNARIGFPEVKLGIFPGSGGVFRLPRIVGPTVAAELLFSGEPIPADEAHRIGLINRLADPGEALQSSMEFARQLVARPALALTLIKFGLHDAAMQDTVEATARTLADSHTVFTGPDIAEGVAAFFEKRPAVFSAPRSTPNTTDD